MCRNIRLLFNFAPPVTDDEVRAAALQYVRKVSGFTHPAKANEAACAAAVDEIAAVTNKLLANLRTTAPPRNREEEAAKARVICAAVGDYILRQESGLVREGELLPVVEAHARLLNNLAKVLKCRLCFFMYATTSCSVLAGNFGLATSTLGARTATVSRSKSLAGS